MNKLEQIDNLIEDIYNLRKEGMERGGEYDILNLIFKEFRNLGYLDNLKDLRKKEISKELSLEHLEESLQDCFSTMSSEKFKIQSTIASDEIEDNLDLADTPIISSRTTYVNFIHSTHLDKDFVDSFNSYSTWDEEELNFISFCIFIKKKYGLLDRYNIFSLKNPPSSTKTRNKSKFYFIELHELEGRIKSEVSNTNTIEDVFYGYGIDILENQITLKDIGDYLFEYNVQTNTFNNKSLLAQEKEKFGIKH